MNISGISLGASMRANLLSLQTMDSLLLKTQERLATGRRVNSALDNAQSFFAASSNQNRANALEDRKALMSQAIQTIKAADAGINGMLKMLDQMKALLDKVADSPTNSNLRLSVGQEFRSAYDQYKTLASDTSYQGTNLLQDGSELTINFNEDASSNLTITGHDPHIIVQTANFTAYLGYSFLSDLHNSDDDQYISAELDETITKLRSASTQFSSNLSVIQSRLDFTDNTINILNEGSDKLTLADMNEESANFLSLQSRQDLSITSLSLASQSQRSVLNLF